MTKPQVPSPRIHPPDLSIAELVAEAKQIIRELNDVNDQLAEAMRDRADHA